MAPNSHESSNNQLTVLAMLVLMVVSGCTGDAIDSASDCAELVEATWEPFPTDDIDFGISHLTRAIERGVEMAETAKAAGAIEEEDACADVVTTACDERWEEAIIAGVVDIPNCFYYTGRPVYVPPDAPPDTSPTGFQTLP